ncbi:Hsp20/alpha crystallin family protein [Bacillus sp. FJAT-47783]|uniref:Hsp20/alpha crystallin family protein n=1 Tax=Bacillus sp. FJAT-47783 TaxID=2922712 RepID=UPI001FAD039E|nr:Hsp20/alpha crystallin family protein [Bacillus sp. FJAT-47783]
MGKKKQSLPCEIKGIEEWMNQFFQDPFTSFLDDYTFRVDLFETSCEYIVEAHLEDVKREDIMIEINKDRIIIAHSNDEQNRKERSVVLPFILEDKWIDATYVSPVLEIKIKKEGTMNRTVNTIPIQ